MNGREYYEKNSEKIDSATFARSHAVADAFEAGIEEGRKRERIATRVHGFVSELKPDRRAELLELASRLAVAESGRPDEPLVYVAPGETFESKVDARRTALAQNFVKTAAAIIAEVDRVSGEVSHG